MVTTRRIHRPTIACALACALLACTPSVASAEPKNITPFVDEPAPRQDLRAPDTRDAANRNQSPTSSLAGTTSQDRRSPDARDTALAHLRGIHPSSYGSDASAAASRIAARQDLRSPDTRDIADGREYPPTPTVVALKEIKAPEPVPATGFDWIAAVAGAATALGVILLMTAATVIVTRRRAHRDQPVAAT
jgi:hypothetical protein